MNLRLEHLVWPSHYEVLEHSACAGGITLVVVHTKTDTVIRIIYARKATKNEEKSYFEEIAD